MKAFLLTVLLLVPVVMGAGNARAADRFNLRDQRYGEVLLGRGGLVMPRELDVYNTIGLNDCPQALWDKLDAEKIKAQTGAKMVKLNGPRYWTIDGMRGSSLVSTEVRDFGGIAMREAGILQLSLADKFSVGKPYVVHKVARRTTWIYKAGQPVFRLVSPDGSVYFMQSYSVQKQAQTLDSLADLGAKLKLPAGWKFQRVNLKGDFELTAVNGMAYVTQDDLDNTYQRANVKAGDAL